MHLGVLCPEIHGHLNPMLALAAELARRGHVVTLVGVLDAESRARAAGIGFAPLGTSEFPPGAHAELSARLSRLSGLAALRFTIDLYLRQAAVLLDEAPDVLAGLCVDALLIDQTVVAGQTIADVLRRPFVTVCGALPLNREPGVPPAVTGWPYVDRWWGRWRNQLGYRAIEWLVRPMDRLIAGERQRRGLPPATLDDRCFSQLAQIGQLPRAFDFPRRQLPGCFHYTGPLVDPASRPEVPFPFEKLDGRPLVYASLGTLQNGKEQIYHAIAEAFVGSELQLVISLGGSRLLDASRQFPGSPLVVDFAPQLELIRRAALVITHAGMNSTMESLAHGKPLVATPVTNDQPAIAARIAWSGCGRVLPIRYVTARRLRAAVQEVLSQPRYRLAATRLQAAIHLAGGVGRAADIAEQAIRTNEPVAAASTP